jgi:hypothetical protein
MSVGSQVTFSDAASSVAIPSASLPSEYQAVQVTVQIPDAASFTVEALHDALVTTECSASTRPGREVCASEAMHACVRHGAELAAACAAADAGADEAEGGAAALSPELAHPDRARAVRVAAVSMGMCLRFMVPPVGGVGAVCYEKRSGR